MKKQRFDKLMLATRRLNESLSRFKDSTDGLGQIVDFFVIINQYEFEVKQLNIDLLFFFNEKKNIFMDNFYFFMRNLNRSENGWNRTLDGDNPTEDSIYIIVSDVDRDIYEDENLPDIFTKNVCDCLRLEKKIPFGSNKNTLPFIKKKLRKERDIMNSIAIMFINGKITFLERMIQDFDKN